MPEIHFHLCAVRFYYYYYYYYYYFFFFFFGHDFSYGLFRHCR